MLSDEKLKELKQRAGEELPGMGYHCTPDGTHGEKLGMIIDPATVLSLIEEVEQSRNQNGGWISVSERLPPERQVRHAPTEGNINGGELAPLDEQCKKELADLRTDGYDEHERTRCVLYCRERQLRAETERAERFWERIKGQPQPEPKGLWEPDSAAVSASPIPAVPQPSTGLVGRMAEMLRFAKDYVPADWPAGQRIRAVLAEFDRIKEEANRG